MCFEEKSHYISRVPKDAYGFKSRWGGKEEKEEEDDEKEDEEEEEEREKRVSVYMYAVR